MAENVLLKIKSLLLLLLLFIILNKILSNPIWPQFYFVAQPGLELLVILAVTPKCWNYRHVPLFLAYHYMATRAVKFIYTEPHDNSKQKIVSKQNRGILGIVV